MNTKLYLVAVLENKDALPKWKVMSSGIHFPAIVGLYNVFECSKLLLEWNFVNGVRISRADVDDCKIGKDYFLDVSLDDIPSRHRSSLFTEVYGEVINFLKKNS